MNLTIIGTGYVGLVTGVCLADFGHHVTCVDIDRKKLERLSRKEMVLYEPGLAPILSRNVDEGRLQFTDDLESAPKDVIFLALPTPPLPEGSADISILMSIAPRLGEWIHANALIINKSTVPVGTTERLGKEIRKYTDLSFRLVSNPEFLREGHAVEDFMNPDRIIVGTQNESVKEDIENLYRPFTQKGIPILYMDEKSAEITKHASNAFLATKITFMNEIANICEATQAQIDHVEKGMGLDPRIGKDFLRAGIGYGGSCFPKDISALYSSSRVTGEASKLLQAVISANKRHRLKLLSWALAHYGSLESKTFALWGLAFKPGTDDIREAPSLDLIRGLLEANARVRVHDPKALAAMKRLFGDQISYFEDAYDCLSGADALFLLTEWNQYCTPDFAKMKKYLRAPVILDGRNVYTRTHMKKQGFVYYSVGRPRP
ncbi:MAG: UDP-glucose/GDP-mannose dehydrogenase family protein [Cytophagales bacterium]|nr:UDP-glucose/GDP-mannose dehydrogenase family protein [Cytophagales bacterium]